MSDGFATRLKEWRRRRRMSQLTLGLAANVSARHISFLETGRARPSRGMVLSLAERLAAPPAVRNAMLLGAGFAPIYGSRRWDDAELAPVRAAVDRLLTRHAPYPGFAIDRHWRLVQTNAPASALFGTVGLSSGCDLIAALTPGGALAPMIENIEEVHAYMAARLRTEAAHLGGDAVLEEAAARLTQAAGPPASADGALLPAAAATRLRVGDATLSLFSTVAQFGAADDATLADLRIELLFPADAPSERWLTQAFSALADPPPR
ncbi:MAG: helix-turn-helix transcriptional regulator [Marivibrio sp.]|uniref:helix-turn-helix transcriptional regulator n=1 Tax=Marivibrio sp. TaxID=2039719 RepID=UPI0032EDC2DC